MIHNQYFTFIKLVIGFSCDWKQLECHHQVGQIEKIFIIRNGRLKDAGENVPEDDQDNSESEHGQWWIW